MAFEAVELPPSILLGSAAGPVWDVDVVEYGQGSRYVQRHINQSRWRFTLRHIIERADIYNDVIRFFESLGGPATGFLLDNWLDNSTNMGGATSSTDMSLGTGDGSTKSFKIYKQYTTGSSSTERRIFKPKVNTISLAVDSSPAQTLNLVYNSSSLSGNDVSVNTSTGIVTFNVAPADGAVITWGGEYYYPVALEASQLDGIMGPDKWYELSPLVLIELLNP